MEKVDIEKKFALFEETWRPKVIAELNGHEVKLVKVDGIFPWHRHDDVDEMFLVWRGRFRIEFRDRIVELFQGQMIVIPRGIEHRTASDEGAEVILIEPANVVNTGDAAQSEYTAPNGTRI